SHPTVGILACCCAPAGSAIERTVRIDAKSVASMGLTDGRAVTRSPRPRERVSMARLRSLKLQDVESRIVVGEVHHALRIDKAVCGLDDLRPVGTRVEHAFWIGRHEEPSLARLERILDVKDPDAGIMIGREDEAGALEGARPVLPEIVGPKLPPLAQ